MAAKKRGPAAAKAAAKVAATRPAKAKTAPTKKADTTARARTADTPAPSATHVALLRALNVGGTSVLPMAELRTVFEQAGARGVRTLQAAGNVWFTASDVTACVAQVRVALAKRLTREPAIMVESLDDLRALVRAAPFGTAPRPDDTTWYVAFLERAPTALPRLPHTIATGDVTYRALKGRALGIVVVPLPGNTSVNNVNPEKFTGVSATVRNWNTILRLVEEKT